MRARSRLFILAVVVTAVACGQPAEAPPAAGGSGTATEDNAPEVQIGDNVARLIDLVMERFDVPGLAVAITDRESVVYSAAFGVRNVDTGEPLETELLFHMASLSKPFVATAILQLLEQGKVALDAPVTRYLPYFELDDERYSQITIEQMLNHTSGLPDVVDYEWGSPETDEGAAERYVRSLTTAKLVSAPGERVVYSNIAFDTLGDVIAKVSGMPFEDYMKKNILDPLEMTHSSFFQPETEASLRTTPHVWDFGPVVSEVYPYNRKHAPSSTLNSSVLEMANWAIANLNSGDWNGRALLAEETYKLLVRPTVEAGENTAIGLSWYLRYAYDTPTMSHGGSDTGYSSYIALLPARGIGIVLASNYDETPMQSVVEGIVSLLFGAEPSLPRLSIADPIGREYARGGIDAARELYLKLERERDDTYRFGVWELNRLGYYLLGKNETDGAVEIFKLNVELFPDSAYPYDSLAEAYVQQGERKLAIENYRESLERDPGNDNAKAMLARLDGAH